VDDFDKHEIVQNYYRNYYSKVHNSGIEGIFARMFHYDLNSGINFINKDVLEIGAGNLIHSTYCQGFSSYTANDLNFEIFLKDETFNRQKSKVDLLQCDVEQILDHETRKYDIILATCVLHHLDNPHIALMNLKKMIKKSIQSDDNSILRFLLPCDPGLVVSIYRRIFSRRKAEKLGVSNFDLVNVLEHKNHVYGLVKLIYFIFSQHEIKIKYYPWRIKVPLFLCSHIVIQIHDKN
jgi:SAM-dependent methyltransferase